MFKNTVLFLVMVVLSCGNKVDGNTPETDTSEALAVNETTPETASNDIIVGANRTSEYLKLLNGKTIGIVANQTSIVQRLQRKAIDASTMGSEMVDVHLVDFLHENRSVNVASVFAPEHGFRGTADAGELVSDGKDIKTGLPIYSLHGKHKKPSDEQLNGLDAVVFDIQDVGVRFYTYISTLHYVMEACAENNIPLIILDRPNPNGNYVDGPTLEKEHSSFLGKHPIPLVHGMTIGEYAQMINGENWLIDGVQCDISIVTLENYTHESRYSLSVRPSPNLPNDQAITLYPSLGLFEGTNINAGRGTEFQFQRYGAPFLDKSYYEFSYTPQPNFGSKYPKHDGKLSYGVDLSEVKAERAFTLKYVIDAYQNSTDKSKVFNTKNFTTHAGTAKLQKQIEAGKTEAEIRKTWEKDLEDFKKTRAKYLIYD
ncbi:DUF1343 domain-containing protein [Winogradskyella maritima]|uniref:Exo-beta-N-acetylmuramidase NamZ domain-containing protein n=1 Tax=Winogradskyella maritima TaxID=1517766 RepID=A0ABV8AHL0_9FLAO|nr:DUF1343 domain-containing protein [Winogradskyella maritima]